MVALIKLMGDFNAKLPTSSRLHKKWYTKSGFNENSHILYDFITFNNLLVLDMCYSKKVDFTYFCYENGHFSWTDHTLCINHDAANVLSCYIIRPIEDGNVSDHLPIRTHFNLMVHKKAEHGNYLHKSALAHGIKTYPSPKWNNHNVIEKYRDILSNKLSALATLSVA